MTIVSNALLLIISSAVILLEWRVDQPLKRVTSLVGAVFVAVCILHAMITDQGPDDDSHRQ
jgi:preprotein translocase subunit SecG